MEIIEYNYFENNILYLHFQTLYKSLQSIQYFWYNFLCPTTVITSNSNISVYFTPISLWYELYNTPFPILDLSLNPADFRSVCYFWFCIECICWPSAWFSVTVALKKCFSFPAPRKLHKHGFSKRRLVDDSDAINIF